MQIFTELKGRVGWMGLMGYFIMFKTVCRWRKEFRTGTESVKYAAKSVRTERLQQARHLNVSKVSKKYLKVMADTQFVMMPYSCWHIAVAGAFHFEAFLKKRKIAARYRIH